MELLAPEIESPSGYSEQEPATLDVSAERNALIEGCRTSLDFLASLILTDIYSYGYCKILKMMWQIICNDALRKKSKNKFALGIPRGFSKTIMLKLYCVWLVLFSDRRFILIVGPTEGHAINFMADVEAMLDHANIKAIFGDWRAAMETKRQDLFKFSFRGRDIVIGGVGANGNPRGLNVKFVRPDVVIMDDIQKKEEAHNEELAKELMVWMLGTLMKACHPQICTFIFVGNMYPYEGCVLRKLKYSKEWLSLITGAINADAESIWPEHRSIEDLLEELRTDTEQGHPEVFFSEVMNDEEAGTVSGIDTSKIPVAPPHLDMGLAQGGAVIIDPSLGKKKSDDVAIGAFLVFDSIPLLRELDIGKFDPGRTIQKATFLAVKYNIQLIVAEAVGYQESLVYWFNQVYAQIGVSGIHVETVSPAGMTKNARIGTMLKMLLSGKILLHKDVRAQVIYQITHWDPLKTNNKDDILDVLAYILKVMNEYAVYIPLLILENLADDERLPPASHEEDLALDF